MKLTDKHRERLSRVVGTTNGRAVSFRRDEIILPDDRKGHREYLIHPGAVGILAFASPQRILLVKQFRYPVGEFTFEIPAGKLTKGEDPLACVARELEEETGYVAKKVQKLASFWPTAAFSNEIIHLYVAEELTPTQMNPDDDEFLELVKVSPRELEAMIRHEKIRDSKTLIAYLVWTSGLRAARKR